MRRSHRAGPTCRADSGNVSRSRAPSSSDRTSTCSTTRSRHSTTQPMRPCASHCDQSRVMPPSSWLPSALARSLLVWSIGALAVVAVTLSILGPKLLGRATDIIFTGVFSSQYPAGMTKTEVVASLRASGQEHVADIVQAMNLHPGQGIDYSA